MAVNPRRLAMLHRRRIVARRYLRGQDQYEIAAALEVSQTTICLDLKAIQRQWEERTLESRKAWIGHILAAIEQIEAEAIQAWERSKLPAETLKARMHGDKGSSEKISKGQAGDARFLALWMQCQRDKAELLALQKFNDNPPPLDGPVEFVEVIREVPLLVHKEPS